MLCKVVFENTTSSSIPCRGSNPQPLDCEPSALTTRPWLSPLIDNFNRRSSKLFSGIQIRRLSLSRGRLRRPGSVADDDSGTRRRRIRKASFACRILRAQSVGATRGWIASVARGVALSVCPSWICCC